MQKETSQGVSGKAKKASGGGSWLKENVEALVVAYMVAMVIRCFCIEVYQIPTSSMEPTILGHTEIDESNRLVPVMSRILATKFFYEVSPIERFDVVVFKFPLDQSKNFIKRVVGLPGEEIRVAYGDIYYRTKEEREHNAHAPFHIARKPLRVQKDVWINPLGRRPSEVDNEKRWLAVIPESSVLSDRELFTKYWFVRGAASWDLSDGVLNSTAMRNAKDVSFEYRKPMMDGTDGEAISDVKLALAVQLLEPEGVFQMQIENEFGKFTLTLSPSRENELKYEDAYLQQVHRFRLKTQQLVPERFYQAEFFVADGSVYVFLNGREEVRYDFIETYDQRLRYSAGGSPRVRWGCWDFAPLLYQVQNLSLKHDIYYSVGRDSSNFHGQEPLQIPAGSYVMFGDNVNNSHDSRFWKRQVYVLDDGHEIVCDGGLGVASKEEKESNPDWRGYDVVVKNDIYGAEHRITHDRLKSSSPPTSYPFVEEKFVMGKAFFTIWLPIQPWWTVQRVGLIR